MAETEEAYLARCWERDICPYCSRIFPATQRVGSGRKKQGGFCSLACYGSYHAMDLAARQARVCTALGEQND